jgi:hypothetical protein
LADWRAFGAAMTVTVAWSVLLAVGVALLIMIGLPHMLDLAAQATHH